MLPKPKHLSPDYAAWFQDPSVVAAYPRRPAYPPEVFDALLGLITDTPRTVLDVGCGLGDLARPLAPLVERVEAVDLSAPIIEAGRRMRGGDHASLRWIHSAVETAPLAPPYALIVAGDSLHWMDWATVLPRFAEVLTPHGVLAMVGRDWTNPPELAARLRPLFRRYSANRDYQPFDLVQELEQRGLFHKLGEQVIPPSPWRPTMDDYIESRHSQNGLSRERMTAEDAAAFDAEVRRAILDTWREGYVGLCDGHLDLVVESNIVWGRPLHH